MKTKELKTLKDLPLLDCIKEMLQREAIKWVKEIERQNEEEFGGLRVSADKLWIIHFFNLTEENLR